MFQMPVRLIRDEPTLLLHSDVKNVALIGAGSVGRSWAALLLGRGFNVVIYDPVVESAAVRSFITSVWPALLRLRIATSEAIAFDRLTFTPDLDSAVLAADLVIENGPESEAFKVPLLARIDALLPSARIILSSSGGIRPTVLQRECAHPQRLVVAHPFNPPHLIPLVEIVGGEATDPRSVEWARQFVSSLGKHPIVIKHEAVGHLANRFQAALMREVFYCLQNDIASANDIDNAVRYGLGLRWALMGPIMTFNLAGGLGGAAHTLELAAEAYTAWWADLGNVELTPDLQAKIISASSAVAGTKSIEQWIAWRDEALVEFITLQQANSSQA